MAFTDTEISEHTALIEELFWSHRRPPLHMRNEIREGQRFKGHSIELFYVRPLYNRPGQFVESPLAKVQYVRTRNVWRLFWKRADNKWHGYQPCLEVASLAEAIRVINEDNCGCFSD